MGESALCQCFFNANLSMIFNENMAEMKTRNEISIGNKRILFVDDQEVLVELALEAFCHLGYQVDAFQNSRQALKNFKARPDAFDLVITDMEMPYLTGEMLAIEIKKIRPNMPIILCTGFSETINAEKAKKIGIQAFLLKPISLMTIARAIENVL